MSSALAADRDNDARLWLVALLASLGINAAVVVVLALLALHTLIFQVPPEDLADEGAAEERTITITPVTREEEPAPDSRRMGFARTSADQPEGIPEDPKFIGERDTLATSDATPDASAPDLPSQTGIEPRVPDELETTESDYQDGDLAHTDPEGAPADPAEMVVEESEAVEASNPPPVEAVKTEESGEGVPEERLANSPTQVDRPAREESMTEDAPKEPTEERDPAEVSNEPAQEEIKEKKPAAGSDPGFRGFQRKTELKGSISRQGRSALDVKGGPLGKYHAALSRAIEQSWQRQVIRNRDFITPGVIRVRVVLDESGRVRSVGTVEEFGVGAIQVGFTHSAIREADLPEMPADVKRELDGEALELLYNFIF